MTYTEVCFIYMEFSVINLALFPKCICSKHHPFTSLQCCFTLDLTQKLQFKASYAQEFHQDSTKCEDRLRHPTIDSSLMLSYSNFFFFLFGEKDTQVLPLSFGKGSVV